DLTQALQHIDIVIHLAAKVHQMQDKDADYSKANALATKNLVEQAAKNKVKRFIFMSSIKVQGESTLLGMPFKEEDSPDPKDSYARSKLEAEHYVQSICRERGMDFVILRPPLVYGPGVRANFLKILKYVGRGWLLPFGKAHNKRSLIYIDNLVSALGAVLEDPKAANQIFLIADKDSLTLTQLTRYLAQEMNTRIFLVPVPVGILAFIFKCTGQQSLNTRLFGTLEVSTSKIQSLLNWTPPIGSEEGLGKTAEWYRHECSR
ncbi:MAG: NAD-dependent epimerase/dehydratase family protein, partial [Legionellales bacterium]